MIVELFEKLIIRSFDSLTDFLYRGNGAREPSNVTHLGMVAHPYYPQRSENMVLDTMLKLHHVYAAGGTGSGKTKLMELLIRQDIMHKNGFCLIDPHGDLIRNILCYLAKHMESDDVEQLGSKLILIEPFNQEWSIGFNPLDASGLTFPAMMELLEIFKRFWGNGYWGPRMDELLRNTFITLAQNRLTLLEARPLLTQDGFRQRLIEQVTFNEVKDYWVYRYNQLSERMQSLYREPVLNKISVFVADPAIYRIIGQRQSTVKLRESMDQGKWILVNLSTGQLRENIRLLGTLFITKLKHAVLSRVDTPEDERRPFYLYIDEFATFVGDEYALEAFISGARKFRLGLTLAHQTLDQLSKELRTVILGNVGTKIFFRLSHHDAVQVSSEMDQKEKQLLERRLIDLRVREAYIKVKGQKPRLLKTAYVPEARVSEEALDRVRLTSFERWARPALMVEQEIEERKNIWMYDEGETVVPARTSNVRPLKDYGTATPDGLFEEGQDEW